MFRVLICICWQTENKKMFRISARHCSKCFKSSFKNIQAVGKIINFQRSSIDRRSGLIDRNHRKIISIEFKSCSSPRNV